MRPFTLFREMYFKAKPILETECICMWYTLFKKGEVAFKAVRFFSIYLALFCIGLANALPLPLMGSTLSIWMAEEGISRSSIGLVSLLIIPFSLRFLWAPVVDFFSVPFFRASHRKGWVVLSLLMMGCSLFLMSCFTPTGSLGLFLISILLLSSAAGCLYISGIQYELDSLESAYSSVGSAFVMVGYRIGLLCGGAGVLYLSAYCGWMTTCIVVACFLCVLSFVIFFVKEPFRSKETLLLKKEIRGQALCWKPFLIHSFLEPARSFFRRADWKAICVVLFVFKLGDELIHSMLGPFYLSLGFDKIAIASVTKVWGMAMTVAGAFIVGLFYKNVPPVRALIQIACLHACSLLCNAAMVSFGNSIAWLSFSIAFENLTGGMAMTLFISFLWRVVEREHAAMQYALLWSLFSIKGEIVGWIGGALASLMPWGLFFKSAALVGIGLACFVALFFRRFSFSVSKEAS